MTTDWKSEKVDQISAALLSAQIALRPAIKDSQNPHFKSRFASLEAVIEAVNEAFHPAGLVVTQLPTTSPDGVTLRTVLLHPASGQWIASDLTLRPKMDDPQKVGACITYARRFALAALACLSQVDDDGEFANGRAPAITSAAGSSTHRMERHEWPSARTPRALPPPQAQPGHASPGAIKWTGRKLEIWAKRHDGTDTVGLFDWLCEHGEASGFPGRMSDWTSRQVLAAHAAAVDQFGLAKPLESNGVPA